MKVLHVYRTAFPDTQGGLEEVIRQICVGTHALGVENRVFSMTTLPNPWVVNLGHSQVHRVQQHLEVASCNMAFRGWSQFRALVAWADVVHYHFPWPFADVLHLANRVQKPSLVTYHSDIIRQKHLLKLYEPLMRQFLRSVDLLVATSPNYAESSPVLRQFQSKVCVIPLGLDAESYPVLEQVALAQYAARWGESFFLFVGVLRYYKGLHVLLDAVKLLADRGKTPAFYIAGKGPEAAALKAQADALKLNNVHFLGFVSDREKVALYRLCKAVVFPSQLRSEAFGVTLLEASMHGKPMISCELGTGTSFVNKNRETGVVVEPANPYILANAIESLEDDGPRTREYGQNAVKRFHAMFSGARMSRSYIECYQSLVKKS